MSLYKDASLVMIPSAYKDGKLYSIRPTDGSGDFTFSRGSNLAATRVDVNGLIEKGRENLLTYSNDFNTGWSNVDVTYTSGQSGYDGSSDAWLYDGNLGYSYQIQSRTGVITFSVYAKAGSADGIRLRLDEAAPTQDVNGYFNLVTGTIINLTGSGAIDSNIESVGGGWYRCSVTMNAVSLANVRLYVIDDAGVSVVGTMYVQDAQLEAGLVATDYIETGASTAQAGILEDMPRLDYSGSCPALLLEPQRSNVVTQSEYFGSWNVARATISDNAATSPEGLSNAAVLTEDTTNNSHPVFNSYTTSNGVSYTFSLFAKQGSRRYLQLFASNGGSSVYYDLQNQTAGAGGDIEDYGNGWSRLIYTYTTNSTSATFYIQPSIDGVTQFYTGDGSNATFLYGAQLEAGSYPTSYIPTYGSSVTRSQEYGRTPHSSYEINEEQGVIFAEFEYLGGTDFQVVSMHNGGSLVDWLMVDSAGRLRGSVFYNSTYKVTMDSSPTTLSANTNYKAAFRYESGNNALYLNGVKVGTNTQTFLNPPTLPYVQLGGFWQLSNTNVNCKIKQTALFNTALTDAELAALTA